MFEPPKRRRFQFRLRTLMIVATLFSIPCAYVGEVAKVVRARKATIREIERYGGAAVTVTRLLDAFHGNETLPSESCTHLVNPLTLVETGQVPPMKLPWLRELLGDDFVWFLYVPETVPKAIAREIKNLFPEAIISDTRIVPAY